MDSAERQELMRLRSYVRRQQMRQTISNGVLGGGILLAGFGPYAAAAGMLVGGTLGYLVERRAAAARAKPGS